MYQGTARLAVATCTNMVGPARQTQHQGHVGIDQGAGRIAMSWLRLAHCYNHPPPQRTQRRAGEQALKACLPALCPSL